jgi:hypothetical protein
MRYFASTIDPNSETERNLAQKAIMKIFYGPHSNSRRRFINDM